MLLPGIQYRKMNLKNDREKVLRVSRSKEQAKKSYDKISRFYDLLVGMFEKKYRNMALERLSIYEGETVLEVGFGTGHCLEQIAKSTGEAGKAYGIDISSGMLEVTRKRLEKVNLIDRVELYCGDAMDLPYNDDKFDAIFCSFTLELFDTPEIPKVLYEIKRVLKPNGRFGLISMSKEDGNSIMIKLYEWIHKKFPKYADCRPIYVRQSLVDAGFMIKNTERVKMFGLPAEIVISENK